MTFPFDRLHVVVPPVVVENSNHRWMCARNRAQDAPFRPPVGPKRGNLNQHAIPVHRRSRGMWRNKNIASQPCFYTRVERSSVRNHEAESVAVHAQPANQRVAPRFCLRNGVAALVDLEQLALFDQRVQPVGKLAALVAFRSQLAQQLLVSCRFFRLAFDVAKDGGIGKHEKKVAGLRRQVSGAC